MNEQLITYIINENGEVIVSSKALHEFLQIKTTFNIWVPRMIEYGFNWDSPKENWGWISSSEIARSFNLKSTKGLKGVMEFYGDTSAKRGGIRGYICPKLIRTW